MSPPPSDGTVPAGGDPTRFDHERRRLFWAMPSGLYLVGSRAGGTRNLMTASWASQVASTPKLLAVSIERDALTRSLVEQGGFFSLSVLSKSDRALVRKFVKPAHFDPEAGTLNGLACIEAPTSGVPIPLVALGSFECRVTEMTPLGSHVLFVGEVVGVHLGEPLSRDRDVQVLAISDTRMNYGG